MFGQSALSMPVTSSQYKPPHRNCTFHISIFITQKTESNPFRLLVFRVTESSLRVMVAETAVVKAKKPRSPPAHPPFVEMITEAIVALKERTGSSQYAITKFVEEKHKQLPQSFRKLLLLNLKKLVASGKLVKVKASFKLPPRSTAGAAAPAKEKTKPEASKPKKSAAAAKTKSKPKTVAKPKAKVAAKPKTKALAVVAKPKVAAKTKAKPAATKPAAKAARTSSRTSPGKKAEVKAKAAKKPAPTKVVKKPKSVKSPAKKKVQPKRGKK